MNLIDRVKETRKLAREKNVPNWYVCLLDAIVITIVFSSTSALYSYIAFDEWVQDLTYRPYWVDMISSAVDLFPLVFAIPLLYKFDRLIIASILFHSWLNRKFMEIVSKLDHKIWKKTGKDAWLSDKMWKATRKFAKLPKRQRKFVVICFMALYMTWYITQFVV